MRFIVFAMWSFLFSFSSVAFATDCNTNCDDSCKVSLPFGGWTIDPACQARCVVERGASCATGLNGCSPWQTDAGWVASVNGLKQFSGQPGVNDASCEALVNGGSTTAGGASSAYAAYAAYVESGVVAAMNTLVEVNPYSALIAMGAKHGSICACQAAFGSGSDAGRANIDATIWNQTNYLTYYSLQCQPNGAWSTYSLPSHTYQSVTCSDATGISVSYKSSWLTGCASQDQTYTLAPGNNHFGVTSCGMDIYSGSGNNSSVAPASGGSVTPHTGLDGPQPSGW